MAEQLVDDVQELVDRLAERVQQSVAIDDPQGNILAISRHYGDEDGYRLKLLLERKILPDYHDFFDPYVSDLVEGRGESPLRVPANPELMIVGRVGYAIKADERVIAILWFIEIGNELPHEEILEYCARLGELLDRRRQRQPRPESMQAHQFVSRLLAGEAIVDDEYDDWLAKTRSAFVVIAYLADAEDPAAATALRDLPRRIWHIGISLTYQCRMDGLEVAVYEYPLQEAESDSGQVAQVTASANRLLAGFEAAAGGGVSGPGDATSFRRLYLDAAVAAFVARHLYRERCVLSASAAAVWESVISAPMETVETPQLEALKSMLLDEDGFAFDTVGAILHSDGDQAHMIELLRVHRSTLHYRISQIEQRTGLDLGAPADLILAAGLWLRVAASRSSIRDLVRERADG